MSEPVKRLRDAVERVLAELPSDRWRLIAYSRAEAFSLEIMPTNASSAVITVTLFGTDTVVDIGGLLTIEVPFEEADELPRVSAIVRAVTQDGLVVSTIGKTSAPLVVRADLSADNALPKATSVDLRNVLQVPRRHQLRFPPY